MIDTRSSVLDIGMQAPPTTPPYVRTRPKSWGIRIGIVVALLGGVGGSAYAAKGHYLPRGQTLPGLRVDGQTATDLKATVESRAAVLAARKVRLVLPGEDRSVIEGTLGELGIHADTQATIDRAERFGKDGDVWSRADAATKARHGDIDVPLEVTIDRAALVSRLTALKETEDREPISARLDLDKHETIPEKDGRYLDVDGTIAKLEALAKTPADPKVEVAQVEIPVATFAPRVSAKFLKDLDIHEVLAQYETYFGRGGDQRFRGKNIDNAAQKLDGLVISPGETVSFNTVVGERSESNGFYKAFEIFKGELVEGIGGGTCQVASTFHAAVFFAGFDVLERLGHSRPSAYIPMGLDSTVVYPAVDLKVRNPHPFPVVVHAKTEAGKLKVELLGKMKPVEVSFGRDVLDTLPFKRKVVEDSALSGKKVLVKQHGIKGYRVRRSRTLKYPDGTNKTENTTDFYPPTVEIYHVPVGFDVALLPGLPGSEDGDAPAATPSAAKTPAANGSTPVADNDAVQFVDAPGAHAPSASQKDPARSMVLKR